MIIIFRKIILKLLFMPKFWLGIVNLNNPKHVKKDIIIFCFTVTFCFFSNLKLAWHPTRWLDWCLSKDKKKSSGANFYWEVLEVLLVAVGSVWYGGIRTFWDTKLCTKSCYNSKIFMNFTNFLCVNFLVQNVPMPTNHILLKWFGNYKLLLE